MKPISKELTIQLWEDLKELKKKYNGDMLVFSRYTMNDNFEKMETHTVKLRVIPESKDECYSISCNDCLYEKNRNCPPGFYKTYIPGD